VRVGRRSASRHPARSLLLLLLLLRRSPRAAGLYSMAPRVPVPIREIVYTLSPYNQEIVVKGMQKFPIKIAKYFQRVRRLHWTAEDV
jgi:Cytochrome b-c1 complex subunit 8